MNSPERIPDIGPYADILPYANAADIEARLKGLEKRLRADDAALFVPAELALHALNGKPAIKAHVTCLLLTARWRYYDAEFEAAVACSLAAVTVAREMGDATLQAKALKILGLSLSEGGRPANAVSVLLEALEYARQAQDDVQISGTLNNLGLALFYGARYGVAHECFEQAISISPTSPYSWGNQGHLLFEAGEIAGGLKAAQRALSLIQNPASVEGILMRVHLEVLMVLLLVAIGDVQQASAHAKTALTYAQGAGELGRRLSRLASLLIDAHDRSVSEKAIDSLLIEVENNQARFSLYRTSLDVAAAALQATGRPHEALQLLRQKAQLNMESRASFAGQILPATLAIGELSTLDSHADAKIRDRQSDLLAQITRSSAATRERLERLITLAIRAELREEDTFSNAAHVYRVSRLAELLAKEARCTDEVIRAARLAGLLHDVGKVAIPDQVLLSRDPLGESEKALVRRHVEDGAAMIEQLNDRTLIPAARAVRHHHERWDGTGYPLRLSEDAIPLAARIVALAEGFDVMTHWRCFRAPRSVSAALLEIDRGAGSQYDPRLAQLLIELVQRLRREKNGIDEFLSEEADDSRVVQEQRRLTKLLRAEYATL